MRGRKQIFARAGLCFVLIWRPGSKKCQVWNDHYLCPPLYPAKASEAASANITFLSIWETRFSRETENLGYFCYFYKRIEWMQRTKCLSIKLSLSVLELLDEAASEAAVSFRGRGATATGLRGLFDALRPSFQDELFRYQQVGLYILAENCVRPRFSKNHSLGYSHSVLPRLLRIFSHRTQQNY